MERLLSGADSHRADRIRIERKAVQEASEKGVWNSRATSVLRAFGAASKGSDAFSNASVESVPGAVLCFALTLAFDYRPTVQGLVLGHACRSGSQGGL